MATRHNTFLFDAAISAWHKFQFVARIWGEQSNNIVVEDVPSLDLIFGTSLFSMSVEDISSACRASTAPKRCTARLMRDIWSDPSNGDGSDEEHKALSPARPLNDD